MTTPPPDDRTPPRRSPRRLTQDAAPRAGPESVLVDGYREGAVVAGRFEIVGHLGSGAMGVVYEARDRLLHQDVAIKIVRPQANRARAEARIRRELQLARRISHPNACRLHDVVVDASAGEANLVLCMELLRGETLAARLERGPLPLEEALPIVSQLAAALQAAHDAGVLHRDLKPSNIMLASSPDGERAVIMDFGIARPLEEEGWALLTGTGDLLGTPAFMAPEQVEGGRVSRATDLYAFGLVIYQMVTGSLPFAADNPVVLALQRTRREPEPPSARVPGLDPKWSATIMRCLERRPAHRFSRACDIPLALTGRISARRPRRWLLVASAAAALPAAAGGLLLWRHSESVNLAKPAGVATPRAVSAERLTIDYGCEEYPTFSPDGRTLIYDAAVGDDYEIVARDLSTGRVRHLTDDPAWDYGAAVSPDGRHVAYIHLDQRAELRVVALTAELERPQVLGEIAGYPAWTSRGTLLVGEDDGTIAWWHHDGGAWRREVAARLQDGMRAQHVAAAPDGVIYVVWRRATSDLERGLGRIVRGRLEVIEAALGSDGTLYATPSGEAFYYTRRDVADYELLRRRYRDDKVERVAGGIAPRSGFAISHDGRQLAYSTCASSSYVVQQTAAGPRVLTPRGEFRDRDLQVLDERRVLLTSNRSGDERVWTLDIVTREMTPVTAGRAVQPAVSPDGRTLVYVDPLGGGLRSQALNGRARALTLTSDASDAYPTFGEGGRQVVFRRSDADGARVHVIPADGGEVRALSSPGRLFPVASPTSDRILYLTISDTRSVVMLTDRQGEEPRLLADLPGRYGSPWMSRDGRRLLLVHGLHELVEFSLDGTPPLIPRRRWHNVREEILSAVEAPDGDGYVTALMGWDGDLWLAQGEF